MLAVPLVEADGQEYWRLTMALHAEQCGFGWD